MKEKVKSANNRKARTRTLIQIGGLFQKASLLPFFDIELGRDDLQSNLDELDKAATLLGFLIHAKDNFLQQEKSLRKEFSDIGKKALKHELFLKNE